MGFAGEQQWINSGGVGTEGQLGLCPRSILREWVSTQDLPVVLIVIVKAQRCPHTGPLAATAPIETSVF